MSLRSQGFVFNDSIKAHFQALNAVEITKDILPKSYSLKKYTPYVHLQLGSECVAYSFASARTILYAIEKNWTDQKTISNNSFSPFHIYFRNKDNNDVDCSKGLNPINVANDLMANGVPKLSSVECPDYYPCESSPPRLCNYYPPSYAKDILEGRKYVMGQITRAENLQQIKSSIFNKRPIVIGMNIPDSFSDAKEKWTPKPTDKVEDGYGHAMVVVAYDDVKFGGAFQLLNSWGTDWGDDGYTWVTYKDFFNFTLEALSVSSPEKKYSESNVIDTSTSDEEIKSEYIKIKTTKKHLKMDQKLSNRTTRKESGNEYFKLNQK